MTNSQEKNSISNVKREKIRTGILPLELIQVNTDASKIVPKKARTITYFYRDSKGHIHHLMGMTIDDIIVAETKRFVKRSE